MYLKRQTAIKRLPSKVTCYVTKLMKFKELPYSQLHHFSHWQKFVKYITSLWMAWLLSQRQIFIPLSKGIAIYIPLNLYSSIWSTYHPSIISSSLWVSVHCCFKNYINHINCSIWATRILEYFFAYYLISNLISNWSIVIITFYNGNISVAI
jgi:hypothetical protein